MSSDVVRRLTANEETRGGTIRNGHAVRQSCLSFAGPIKQGNFQPVRDELSIMAFREDAISIGPTDTAESSEEM